MQPGYVKEKTGLGVNKDGKVAGYRWIEFDYSAISHTFNLYGIPPGQRPVLFDKCIVLIGVIQEAQK